MVRGKKVHLQYYYNTLWHFKKEKYLLSWTVNRRLIENWPARTRCIPSCHNLHDVIQHKQQQNIFMEETQKFGRIDPTF
jgi:hypothetical protein